MLFLKRARNSLERTLESACYLFNFPSTQLPWRDSHYLNNFFIVDKIRWTFNFTTFPPKLRNFDICNFRPDSSLCRAGIIETMCLHFLYVVYMARLCQGKQRILEIHWQCSCPSASHCAGAVKFVTQYTTLKLQN